VRTLVRSPHPLTSTPLSHIQLQADPAAWGSPDALAVALGTSLEENRYRKTTAVHLWLFTYELPGECWLGDELCVCVCGGRVRGCACAYKKGGSRPHQRALRAAPAAPFVSAAHPFLSPLFTASPDTIMVFTKAALHVLTSTKKGKGWRS
jgi:hypothetical protein